MEPLDQNSISSFKKKTRKNRRENKIPFQVDLFKLLFFTSRTMAIICTLFLRKTLNLDKKNDTLKTGIKFLLI
jgi:hypothetical protein